VAEREEESAKRRKSGRGEKISINLTNADIPRVINGTEDDADEERPFSHAFGTEYVKAAWDGVGVVGEDGFITLEGLNHPKVREGASVVDKSDTEQSSKKAEVRAQYDSAMAELHHSG
jgi:hypothetical protein